MGEMRRDFTFIDNLVEAVTRLIDRPPATGEPAAFAGAVDSLSPAAPWRVVNIAGGPPVSLLDFVDAVEGAVGGRAERIMLPMQPGRCVRPSPTLACSGR
jgi:UDP-glucuronate 4-epimerase